MENKNAIRTKQNKQNKTKRKQNETKLNHKQETQTNT